MSKSELSEKITSQVYKLPPIPENIYNVLQEASREERDEGRLKAIIKNDPGLCSELLHQAACLKNDRSKSIETLDEAIEIADLEYLIDLVGASCLAETISKEFSSMKHLDEYFQHSREIAATCPILADVLGLSEHDIQFYEMAGILHDIGRLIIRLASDQKGARLMGTSPEKMATVTQEEDKVSGLNHCEVGKQVCHKWDFSENLFQAVERHHTPLIDNDFSFSGSLLFVSHFISGSDFTGEIITQIFPPELFDNLNLTPELFDEACRRYNNTE